MKVKFVVILLLVSSIIFVGCKKSKEKKIVGTWELIEFGSSSTTTIWKFYDSDMLVITSTDTSGFSDADTANYEVKEKFLKYYAEIANLSADEDGSYHIEKLNNSVMILQCNSPNFIIREFSKQ